MTDLNIPPPKPSVFWKRPRARSDAEDIPEVSI